LGYDEDDDGEYTCNTCGGSGEGTWDGSTCSVCRGSGVVYLSDGFDEGYFDEPVEDLYE
jgi:DnaJ-class molecular chaperone